MSLRLGVGALAAVGALLVGIQFVPSTSHAQPGGPQYTMQTTHSINRPGVGSKTGASIQSAKRASQVTAAEKQAFQQRLQFEQNLPTPPVGKTVGNAAPTNPAQVLPSSIGTHTNASPGGPLANTTLDVAETSLIPAPCCFTNSSIFEPSVAGAGAEQFLTGNWTVDFSNNGGSSWFADDPANPSWAGANFCCDQQVIYEPGRDMFIMEQLDLNSSGGNGLSLTMFNRDSAGTFLCHEFLDSTLFGMPANQVLDFPDIQFGTDYTYVTWNTYDPTGATWENTGIVRLDTQSLHDCSGLFGNYFLTSNNFSFTLVSGSTEAMNFASNWFTDGSHTNGTFLRFWNWNEVAGSLGAVDLAITPFAFYGRGGANCSGPSVGNWCARADSRRGTAYLSRAGFRKFGGQVIGFAFNANAGGGFPYPYAVREYFVLPTLTYKGTDAWWYNSAAVAYPSLADSPYRGYVGGSANVGGGSSNLFPGTVNIQEDVTTPTYNWSNWLISYGGSNPWQGVFGDYTTTREWSDHLHTVSAEYYTDGSGNTVVYFVLWGRARDHSSFADWISK